MEQHDRASSENVCGLLARCNSAASKQVPPEIIDRRQHAATGFQGGSAGQWDWMSVISPLPTSTMGNVVMAPYTQREFVAGSQKVIVQEHTDEDTPGGRQHEGIDKKTQHSHKHRKHKKKKDTPIKKQANEHSTNTAHLVPFVITEQTTRDQSLSDPLMSSPQPLSESWMRARRTEGDTRTQQETVIHDITRSGDGHAKKHKHSKHYDVQHSRDIAEGRCESANNVAKDVDTLSPDHTFL